MNRNQTGKQQNIRDAVLQEHTQGGAGGGVAPIGKTTNSDEIIRQVIGRGDASVDVGAVPTEGERP